MSEAIRIEPDDCEVTLKSAQRLSEALGYEWDKDCVGSKELFFVDQDGKRKVEAAVRRPGLPQLSGRQS